MLVYITGGFLFIETPMTPENEELLGRVVEMLHSTYHIGERQITLEKSGGFKKKNRRYELCAMLSHAHPGAASQDLILSMVRKTLGLD